MHQKSYLLEKKELHYSFTHLYLFEFRSRRTGDREFIIHFLPWAHLTAEDTREKSKIQKKIMDCKEVPIGIIIQYTAWIAECGQQFIELVTEWEDRLTGLMSTNSRTVSSYAIIFTALGEKYIKGL